MSETTPQATIEADVKTALKAGEKDRVSTLRMLLTELKNERIRSGGEVDQKTFYGLVQKGIKQRQESAEAFRKAGREESAAKEEREAEILEEYLPAQVSEDELRQAIEALAEEKDLAGMKDLGQVMGPMMQRFAGKADGSTVQKLAREVLAARDEG